PSAIITASFKPCYGLIVLTCKKTNDSKLYVFIKLLFHSCMGSGITEIFIKVLY
ncbi:hypothetical protein HMPREF0080_00802, partial [Anaeroglobus geminatus F0357]